MPRSRSTIRILIAAFTVFSTLFLGACQNKQQFGGFYQQSFNVTPKCGISEQLLTFGNVFGDPLEILGIAFSAGTNGGGHFSIQGLRLGSQPEIEANAAGGINEVTIPPGETYSLRVRYSPLEESGDTIQTAIIDIAYVAPNSGIVQVEVSGRSVGESDCPELIEGSAEGLSGTVDLTITKLVAATTALGVPLSSEMGKTDFVPVELSATITDSAFDFPQITTADQFILPEPDPTKDASLVQLASVVNGDTVITSAEAVTGTIDTAQGILEIPDLAVTMTDEKSIIKTVLDLTTEFIDPGIVSKDKLNAGGFTIIDGQVNGLRIQEDGTVELVGVGIIDGVQGPLADSGDGLPIVVRILATILCPNGTTVCDSPTP